MKNKIYIATIQNEGTDADYVNIIFASTNKIIVKNWVSRFNKIITNNRERIMSYNMTDFTKLPPYWYYEIRFDNPIGIMDEIELR